MSLDFGLAEYKGAFTGLHLLSVSIAEAAQPVESVDEDGNIEQIDHHSRKLTLTASGNVVSGGNLAALKTGGSVTVRGYVFKMNNVTLSVSPTNVRTVSISGDAPLTASGGVMTSGGAAAGA